MSRIGKQPVKIESGISVTLGSELVMNGAGGKKLSLSLPSGVSVTETDGFLHVVRQDQSQEANTREGTIRALLSNMMKGVSKGFERKLELVGTGYRAALQGNQLNLTLGFSHPVIFEVPTGITITLPTNVEIIVAGSDKQLVGQVAAKIRAYRPPNAYKGKGVRYADEVIVLKETKKK